MTGLIEIFTDGSACPGIGGGWAAVFTGAVERSLAGSEPSAANNPARMELLAAVKALEALDAPSIVTLYSDFAMLQATMRRRRRRLKRWRDNGWLTGEGKPVKGRDLWERLEAARAPHHVRWQWMRRSDLMRFEEHVRADALARQAAQQGRLAA